MMRHMFLGFRSSWLGLLAVAILTLAVPLAALGASSRTVDVTDDSYNPKTFSVEVGTTVVFKNTSTLPHTATADNGSFDTGMIAKGESKSVTLKKTGTFPFYCQYHGAAGGVGQSGTITVTAAAAPAPSGNSGGAVPATDTLPTDVPVGMPGLGLLALAVAGIGSVVIALAIESVRGAMRRRPGR